MMDGKTTKNNYMNYVIKSKRLMQFLYNLGLNYKQVPDQTGKQNYVYLFENDIKLQEALEFYNTFKLKHIYN